MGILFIQIDSEGLNLILSGSLSSQGFASVWFAPLWILEELLLMMDGVNIHVYFYLTK